MRATLSKLWLRAVCFWLGHQPGFRTAKRCAYNNGPTRTEIIGPCCCRCGKDGDHYGHPAYMTLQTMPAPWWQRVFARLRYFAKGAFR